MNKAPVIVFAYRKYEFLSEILREVIAYKPPKLYVSLNKYKDESEIPLTENVIREVRQFNFPFEVEIIQHEMHLSVNDVFHLTLNMIFSKEESLIVLEDDTVPSSSFFTFCNIMLNKFKNDKHIGCINGCNLNTIHKQNTYFLSNLSLPFWGWATWKDRWKLYRNDNFYWQKYRNEIIGKVDISNKDFWISCFENNSKGINVWDIQWSISLMANQLKSIMPGINLISNRGFVPQALTTINTSSRYRDIPSYIQIQKELLLLDNPINSHNYESEVVSFIRELVSNLEGSAKERIINS